MRTRTNYIIFIFPVNEKYRMKYQKTNSGGRWFIEVFRNGGWKLVSGEGNMKTLPQHNIFIKDKNIS